MRSHREFGKRQKGVNGVQRGGGEIDCGGADNDMTFFINSLAQIPVPGMEAWISLNPFAVFSKHAWQINCALKRNNNNNNNSWREIVNRTTYTSTYHVHWLILTICFIGTLPGYSCFWKANFGLNSLFRQCHKLSICVKSKTSKLNSETFLTTFELKSYF